MIVLWIMISRGRGYLGLEGIVLIADSKIAFGAWTFQSVELALTSLLVSVVVFVDRGSLH